MTIRQDELTSHLPRVQSVQAEVVIFTVVFVLLTLLVNAPMLPRILRWTRLSIVPQQHVKMRAKAVRLLSKHTASALKELCDDEDEMLRGALQVCKIVGDVVCHPSFCHY